MFSARASRCHVLISTLCLSCILSFYYVSQHDRALYAVLTFSGLRTLSDATTAQFPPSPEVCQNESSVNDKSLICANFPDERLSEVQIVIKTGAAERGRTQSLLETIGLCITNALVVSDAEDQINEHVVVDILADLLPTYAVTNTDWKAYDDQKRRLANGETISWSKDFWNLDRFKFFPMIERAFAKAPNAKWYVFIESDTYYFWDTLFRQLDLLDSTQYHYLGSPTPAAHGLNFVYGGGGIVMSHRLVHDLLKGGQQKLSVKYEELVRSECCGDSALTYAIYQELGIRMESLGPTITGSEFAFLRIQEDTWCSPLVGLHRVTPDVGARLWRWERCRGYSETPITYSTLLDLVFDADNESGRRKLHWDNLSDQMPSTDGQAHLSADACKKVCEEDFNCVQYRFSNDEKCRTATWIAPGRAVGDKSKGVVSGWVPEHFIRLGFSQTSKADSFCSEARWSIPKIV